MLESCDRTTQISEGLPSIAQCVSVAIERAVQRRRRRAPFMKKLGGQGYGKPILSRRTSAVKICFTFCTRQRRKEASWIFMMQGDRYRTLPVREVVLRDFIGCFNCSGRTGGQS